MTLRVARILSAAVVAGPLLSGTGLPAQDPPLPIEARSAAPPATVEGHVVDSLTGRPIPGVLVRLDTGAETFSSSEGRFRLTDVPPGAHMLALLTADCRVNWREVDLEPGDVSSLTVRLSLPFGVAARQAREAAERRRSEGTLVTAEEIQEMNAVTLADVIRRLEPTMIGNPANMVGSATSVSGRSRNSFTSRTGAEEPVVLIDGVRATDGSRALAEIHPSDVGTLELLPGAAAGWEFGSAGSAGVIRVTTRRHGDAAAPGRVTDGPGGCVVPGFPRG